MTAGGRLLEDGIVLAKRSRLCLSATDACLGDRRRRPSAPGCPLGRLRDDRSAPPGDAPPSVGAAVLSRHLAAVSRAWPSAQARSRPGELSFGVRTAVAAFASWALGYWTGGGVRSAPLGFGHEATAASGDGRFCRQPLLQRNDPLHHRPRRRRGHVGNRPLLDRARRG